ncbi:restriction endonuclease subunit S [Lampropedia puyangensis]|uniref:Restriction endonuclease subunit S n=1 Tax=Lampropedia puyangensis TaxID=1330072 RepID=A0A4S8FCV6_9BURK|nr:restriction endonuclease subunit S [Lampropedia puyangensis]THU05139.1 restriction endonuclease subunit S [Lampropedia puyangensis]
MDLPKGWVAVDLGDVCEFQAGYGFPIDLQGKSGQAIPFYKVKDISAAWLSDSRFFLETENTLSEHEAASIRAKPVPVNSVVFAKIGEALRLNRRAITKVASLIDNNTMAMFAPANAVDVSYLYWFSLITRFDVEARASVVPSIRKSDVETISFPLAPRAEQTRIVEKLEALLSELDAGVAELKVAQKKLKAYRQSLLKAAVEGTLTVDWRAAQHAARKAPTDKATGNTSVDAAEASSETGQQLLARILTERRTRWEAKQLAKFQAQNKTPPKGWQSKYPEPTAPDTADLPQLPEGWVWATLSQVGWLDRGKSKHRPRNAPHLYGGPYPFVQTGDIRHADTFLGDIEATYSEAGLAQSRLWPAGTMCITIAANIGKTAILSVKACFPDSVVGFLPAVEDVSIRYVEYFMRSAQQKLESEAPATAQKNINLEILEKLVIPVPPTLEQNKIASELENLLAAARNNDLAIEYSLKQATAQRQNILRAAFAGQLVPQDPNDEPASTLLERLRSERAAQAPSKKPRGRKAKEAS